MGDTYCCPIWNCAGRSKIYTMPGMKCEVCRTTTVKREKTDEKDILDSRY